MKHKQQYLIITPQDCSVTMKQTNLHSCSSAPGEQNTVALCGRLLTTVHKMLVCLPTHVVFTVRAGRHAPSHNLRVRRDGITDNVPAASPFIITLYVADAEGDIKSGKYVGPTRCKYLWGLKY